MNDTEDLLWQKRVAETLAAVEMYGNCRAAYVKAQATDPTTPHVAELFAAEDAFQAVRARLLGRPFVPEVVAGAR